MNSNNDSSSQFSTQSFLQCLSSNPDLFEWIEQFGFTGFYCQNIDTNEQWSSDGLLSLLDADSETSQKPLWWLTWLSAEEHAQMQYHIDRLINAKPWNTSPTLFRFSRASSVTRYLKCEGRLQGTINQHRLLIVGFVDCSHQHEIHLRSEPEETNHSINQLALRTAGIGTWAVDLQQHKLVYWSREMYQLLRQDPDSFSHQYHDWQDLIHPDDRGESIQAIQSAIRTASRLDLAFRIIRGDGEIRYIRNVADIFFDDDKNPSRIIGASFDVHSEAIETKQLRRSNFELSRFAASASHDLKSPLRGIRQLATWIEEDLNKLQEVPAGIGENLELLKKRVGRMEKLLIDLLAFSRIPEKNQARILDSVDTESLAREVFEFLSPPSGINLTLKGTFPVIPLEKAPFEQVLRNLIGNAIKHRDSPQGHVMVSVSERPHHFLFKIEDDGSGIPEHFHKKIFDMFQTLKPKDQNEGTGMGLAIVKKIIDTQGGEIWLESKCKSADLPADEQQTGTTFYFTWPKVTTIGKT